MKLNDLLKLFETRDVFGSTDIEVTDICYHSKRVSPGALFVALPGLHSDGRQFAHDAAALGAVAIVFEGEFFDNLGMTQIRVRGVREVLARLSAEFFVHPSKEFYLTGVTGTNGKTTLTQLVGSLWHEAALTTGLVGTLGVSYNNQTSEASHTTPESRDLQSYFSRMVRANVTHVAMEVSSHAICQSRIQECHFDSCVFTNLTQDHLDYHPTLDAYYLAKESLFKVFLAESSKSNKLAVVCGESAYATRLLEVIRQKHLPVITYGLNQSHDIFPLEYEMDLRGIRANIQTPRGELKIESPLIGDFNLLNIMGAIAVAHHSGVSNQNIEQALRLAVGAKGRLERVADNSGRLFFVDYAHTPDALTNVLKTIKALAPNKIIVVFGCGGDRDKTKRPLMGEEVAKYADVALVTSDNPRTEDPDRIIKDIIPGLKNSQMKPWDGVKGYLVESDRALAIKCAVGLAQKGDVVLVAGKGHEDYQIIGTTKYHFSDQEELRK